jgi:hypothetical protein
MVTPGSSPPLEIEVLSGRRTIGSLSSPALSRIARDITPKRVASEVASGAVHGQIPVLKDRPVVEVPLRVSTCPKEIDLLIFVFADQGWPGNTLSSMRALKKRSGPAAISNRSARY